MMKSVETAITAVVVVIAVIIALTAYLSQAPTVAGLTIV